MCARFLSKNKNNVKKEEIQKFSLFLSIFWTRHVDECDILFSGHLFALGAKKYTCCIILQHVYHSATLLVYVRNTLSPYC